MSDIRYKVWLAKTGRKTMTSTPKLQTLQPTSESFIEHVKRAHYQAYIWRSSMEQNFVALDPDTVGWVRDEKTKSLLPKTLPQGMAAAPNEILEMIHCGCSTEPFCSPKRCGCASAQLGCSIFCACEGTTVGKHWRTFWVGTTFCK